MNDNFQTILSSASLFAPSVPPAQIMDFTARSLQDFWYRKNWSWKKKTAVLAPKTFTINPLDTCSITSDQATVTSTLGSFTPAMVNMQLRVGTTANPYPYYTIIQWISGFQVVLDRTWAGPDIVNASFYVGQVYFSPPEDFESFCWASVPAYNYRMDLSVTQMDLAAVDAQRSIQGNPACLVPLDYNAYKAGTIGPVTRVGVTSSVNPAPVSTTTLGYTYPTDLTFVVKITAGGNPGFGLVIAWYIPQLNAGGATPVSDSLPIDLSFGAQIYFPIATYVLNDEFVFTCSPGSTSGAIRYEIWPRPQIQSYVIPYQYNLKLPKFDQDDQALPEPLARRGDTLLDLVKSNVCSWPGTEIQRNPVYDPRLARQFKQDANDAIHQMELLDDDISKAALRYQNQMMAYPTISGYYLYNHDIPWFFQSRS